MVRQRKILLVKIDLNIPKDRKGEFNPQIVKNKKRDI